MAKDEKKANANAAYFNFRNFAFVLHCSKSAWIPFWMWHNLKSLFKESMLIKTVDLIRLQRTLCKDRKANGNDCNVLHFDFLINSVFFSSFKSYYRNLPYKNVNANPCTVPSFHLMFCHSLVCSFLDAVIDTGLLIMRSQAFNQILHIRIDMKIDYNRKCKEKIYHKMNIRSTFMLFIWASQALSALIKRRTFYKSESNDICHDLILIANIIYRLGNVCGCSTWAYAKAWASNNIKMIHILVFFPSSYSMSVPPLAPKHWYRFQEFMTFNFFVNILCHNQNWWANNSSTKQTASMAWHDWICIYYYKRQSIV